MCEFVYTTYPDRRAAVEDLKKKITYEPELIVLFVTKDLVKYNFEFSRLFGNTVVCVPIEGYVTREGVWTRGALAWLIDSGADVEVYRGSADRVCRELQRSRTGKFSMLIYPAFYFGSRLSTILALLRERKYYGQYKRGDKNALKKASDFLKEKFVYPINDILRPFRDRRETAISLNLIPLEARFNTPAIAVNDDTGRMVVRIRFRKSANINYEDTFPDRGEDFEDAVEILRNEFSYVKIVEIEKSGVALGHVNGLPAVKFVASEGALITGDLRQELKRGAFLSTPYTLWFISRATSGFVGLGVLPYPLGIYPSLYSLDNFHDRCVFSGESSKELLRLLFSFFDQSGGDGLYIIDQNYILMFEDRLVDLTEVIGDGFGVFTYSSVTMPKFNRKLATEVEDGICMNLTRNITYMEL